MAKKTPYKRILLKLSGEAFLGKEKGPFDVQALQSIAGQIQEIQKLGTEIGVVIGGGNILRGSQSSFLREKGDQMGMLATAINGMMLTEALLNVGCPAFTIGAFRCGSFIPEGSGADVLELLENGVVVVFVGGTGHPYFTTDTAAALRACEIGADVLIKATKVDGIYDKDPLLHPKARHLQQSTYQEVLSRQLDVMDGAAIALCQDNHIPIHVLNIFKKGALKTAVQTQSGGSRVAGSSK